MNTDMIQNQAGMTVLESLAAEARAYSESMAMNMFQLGRVFTEAKEIVPHGEWQSWVEDNAGMGMRSAQQLIQIYARFGALPSFSGVDKSKLIKMLSLPAGTEENFLEEHDVDSLSSREVDEEVKRIREEAQTEIDRERNAREKAETRVREMEDAPRIPDDIADTLAKKDADMQKLRGEIDRLTEISQGLMDETKAIPRMENDLRETETMLREKQDAYNALQAQLLQAKSAEARGEADTAAVSQTAHAAPDGLVTVEDFAAAVRQFIGVCAPMTQMATLFAGMDRDRVAAYEGQLRTAEACLRSVRRAIDTIHSEVIEP